MVESECRCDGCVAAKFLTRNAPAQVIADLFGAQAEARFRHAEHGATSSPALLRRSHRSPLRGWGFVFVVSISVVAGLIWVARQICAQVEGEKPCV